MRPLLKPALRRLWRDRSTLQLGIDPERAVVVTGLDPVTTRFVEQLDGTRELAGVYELADRVGLPRREASRVLALLAEKGLLEDATGRPTPVPMTRHDRARLGPDLASLALTLGDGASALSALERRAAAVVAVHGAGRIGSAVAALVAAAGVGHVVVLDRRLSTPADSGPAGYPWDGVRRRREGAARASLRRAAPEVSVSAPRGRENPDVAVILPEGRPDPEPGALLVRRGVPHVFADIRETSGLVGPFVLPGRTACGRCVELWRSDLDPQWPRLLAQLAATSGQGDPPCDVVLATEVAARTAMQVLCHLDGGTPAAVNGTVEIALPDGRTRRRTRAPHPRCDCGAARAHGDLAPEEVGTITHAEAPGRPQWVG